MKIVITTHPFNYEDPAVAPLLQQLRDACGAEIKFNNKLRKFSSQELLETLSFEEPDIIIAGTERYGAKELDLCKNLKMISRVGIGLDSLDLRECQRRKIVVAYTPDAPSNAVAELTISQILSLLRSTHKVDAEMRAGNWSRIIGRELRNCCVGVIGNGRIGSLVIEKLESFRPKKLLYTDTDLSRKCYPNHFWSTKEQILKECDVISVHIPLNEKNLNYLKEKELSQLKQDVVLINTSRGGIVNEDALFYWLKKNPHASAAIDVFEDEPYNGRLLGLSNVLLSPHLGSCSRDSRLSMEMGATMEVLNFINKRPLHNEVLV
jgi:D-3-phosphoglycerate dehydrogenase